ncbi:hypothetical protein ACIHFD_49465 [Nonomuraea sp. NPDC051941]|uniref:hypothetical protein n=1 Tax=Nonomuraea sp. NPDC051941 TaxID=3364373 RepID=UPI0037C8C3BE
MNDDIYRQRLTGRQLRDLIGGTFMVLGAVLTCLAAFMIHPAAGFAVVGAWLLGAGWLLASSPASVGDEREGGR